MTYHHSPVARVYYRPEMSMPYSAPGNFSLSPTKPRRFVEHLARTPIAAHLETVSFKALTKREFRLAHTARYVDAFFRGEGALATSNWLAWDATFARTVRYTNGSLVAAVRGALDAPSQIALSPSSGFHHARPEAGSGFCTFSGQVIAAVLAYRERGARGAWIDLDGHFGNSIEDSRDFVRELDAALPFNINPRGVHKAYLADLTVQLARLEAALVAGEVDYVAFAHGADSHEWDDLGGQVSTAEWLDASRLVYGMIARASEALGRPVPTVLALFGGYRQDDLASVLELHTADLAIALSRLGGADLPYAPRVTFPVARAAG